MLLSSDELALGLLRRRDQVLDALGNLPRAKVAEDEEVLGFIEDESLGGLIGYIDAHLLAATRWTLEASFWTRDRRLAFAEGLP